MSEQESKCNQVAEGHLLTLVVNAPMSEDLVFFFALDILLTTSLVEANVVTFSVMQL